MDEPIPLDSLEKVAVNSSTRAYLCGPETFRALLLKFSFIPKGQRTFKVDAGLAQTMIMESPLVPDDGSFYPCPASMVPTLPELPRSF